MVLHVDFQNLGEEAKRHGLKPWAYLSTTSSGIIATVGDSNQHLVIQSETRLGMDAAKKSLTEQGLLFSSGRWLPDPLAGEIQIQEQLWVAAVAYKSYEEKPGLWVNAYRGSPSVGDVLRDFHQEMSQEAAMDHVSVDEMVQMISPNVVIFGPNDLANFADNASS